MPPHLSGETVAALLDCLYAITSAIEQQYAVQIMRYESNHRMPPEQHDPSDISQRDPPL
jgi:hypothetical protein